MNITILSSTFPPEPVVSAQTSASLTRSLVVKGHVVQVITSFPNRPAGKLFPGYKRSLLKRENNVDGYKIIRCFTMISPVSSLLSRVFENVSFGLSAGIVLLFMPKPDVIYANTWPIFADAILMLVAKTRRIPVVLSIQDIYPDSLVIQGRLRKSSCWYKFLLAIDNWISFNAEKLILLSETFAQIYVSDRKIDPGKITIVPNWIDESNIKQQDLEIDIRRNHNINENDFLVIYGGNIGTAADLETVIRAFGLFEINKRIQLLIAGSGSKISVCIDLAEKIAPDQISFHSPWLNQETYAVLSAADILILPTLGNQSTVSIPSKLINYMFSGKPVIALVNEDSETADVIRTSGCGWILKPGQVSQLNYLIEKIIIIPKEELNLMGDSGRKFAEKNFSGRVNLSKIHNVLEAYS